MVVAKFSFILMLSMFMSCEKFSNNLSSETVNTDTEVVQTRSLSSDSYEYYNNVALFHDHSDSAVYFLRYDRLPSSRIQLDKIEVLGKYDNPVRLEIKDNKTNTIHQIGFTTDIYGIGFIDGASSVQAILDPVVGGGFTLPEVMDGEAIACNCFETTDIPDNCDHGGTGSTSCSVTESTPLYEVSCSVSCGGGTVACCTADADWN